MIPIKGKLYKISFISENSSASYEGIAWCTNDNPVILEGLTCWHFKLANIDSNGELAMFTEADVLFEICTE